MRVPEGVWLITGTYDDDRPLLHRISELTATDGRVLDVPEDAPLYGVGVGLTYIFPSDVHQGIINTSLRDLERKQRAREQRKTRP